MYIAADTETTGLDVFNGCRPFAFSFTRKSGDDEYYRFNVDPMNREVLYGDSPPRLQVVRNIYENPKVSKVFHNASFDIKMLNAIGIHPKGDIHDTLILCQLYDNSYPTYALKPLCARLFDFTEEDEKELKQSVIRERRKAKKEGWEIGDHVEEDYWLGDPELCKKYAIQDTQRTMKLWEWLNYQMSKLKKEEYDKLWNIYVMEMKLLKAVMAMETRGIRVDLNRAFDLTEYYDKIVDDGKKIKEDLGYGDLNTRSFKQMKEVFYDELKMPAIYTKGKLTCGEKALKKWAKFNKLAESIINMNTANHELTSFVEPIVKLASADKKGQHIIHPLYRTVGTKTGRLSCGKPNLQNIPNTQTKHGDVENRPRELFIPREGHVLYFPDYSQIEVWLAAFCSKDPTMMDSLIKGLDMHDKFAKKFFGMRSDYEKNKEMYRKKTKNGTFATIYGAGVTALSETLDCSRDEAREFLMVFHTTYDTLTRYGKELEWVAKELGYIEDNFGRKYHIPNPEIAYKSLNYMIQGSAAGVMKRAITNVDRLLKNWPGSYLLLTIHDELCIEIPLKYHSKQVMVQIVEAMQGNFHTYFDMPNPFKVSMAWTDTRWSEKKEVEL